MVAPSSDRRRGGQSTRYIIHGLIFFLCLLLMVFSKADISAINSVRSAVTRLVAPIADLISVPVRAVGGAIDQMQALSNLHEENQRLEVELEKFKRWRRKAELLQIENRQLRSVSGIMTGDAVTPISAQVIATNADSFAHAILIKAGSEQGIKKGHAVTTIDGLVGVVINVAPYYSQILLITDINAMIPVVLSSSWPAMTVGQGSKSLRLRFLPTEGRAIVGELIQTSGHGGIFPSGIPVGRVASVGDDHITVKPIVNLQRLTFVTVLVSDRDTGFSLDDLANQAYNPLPPSGEESVLQEMTDFLQKFSDNASTEN